MGSIDVLAMTKPKENAGSKSSNRFGYQINWGLKKLLMLEESGEDYIMIFDYHDDIVVCNSIKDADFIDFYQIKTKMSGSWAIGTLNSRTNESEDEVKVNNGLGILSKLISHTKVFDNCRNLYFVTNSFLSSNVYGRSEECVAFNELKDKAKKSLIDRVKQELGDIDDSAFDKIVFIQNQMNIDGYKDTLVGILNKFLKDKYNLVTDVQAVYDTLIGELTKRNNYEIEIENRDELLKHKSISHEEFRKYLESLTIQKGFEKIKDSIRIEIANEVNFFTKDNVIRNLNVIYQELMDYENDELQNLVSEIRNTISENPVTADLQCVWDYANNIFQMLIPEYNNYKKHSDMYIKSLILYIYEKDRQRFV